MLEVNFVFYEQPLKKWADNNAFEIFLVLELDELNKSPVEIFVIQFKFNTGKIYSFMLEKENFLPPPINKKNI